VFWEEPLSLRDGGVFDTSVAAGHRQLTDIYLLGLAQSRGGRLATFDRSIPLRAVVGASPADLAVISAAD